MTDLGADDCAAISFISGANDIPRMAKRVAPEFEMVWIGAAQSRL